jgi:phospholipid-transporting ATPase
MIEGGVDNKIKYQGSSPDEIALINAARLLKYIYKGRDINNIITLDINGQDFNYECLNVLEYTSDRKKMSVIIKCPDGKIRLFMKGADNVIRKLITLNTGLIDTTDQHLLEFAHSGLRTLMIAYKEIPDHEYNEWNQKFFDAVNNPVMKDKLLPSVFDEIEKDLYLLGATAINDQLQDNVSETLEILSKAGIKIWMLTGDKMDTAKSIAYSCRLLTENHETIELREGMSQSDIKITLLNWLENCLNSSGKFSLIVGMDELNIILKNPTLLDEVLFN